MSQIPAVVRMLQELGTTPDQVAQSLAAKQIKGIRNAVRVLNPIVRYVQTGGTLVDDLDVMLGHTLRVTFPPGKKQEVPLPPAVIGFLNAFNRGAYPGMELPVENT